MSDKKTITELMQKVGEAEKAFLSRWHLSTLEKIDAELYQNVMDQLSMYNEALVTESVEDAVNLGEGMIRGYAVAVKAMDEAGAVDDAYFVGFDRESGRRLVISERKDCLAAAIKKQPGNYSWIAPDEVARIFFGLEMVQGVKELWPDAEVSEVA